MLDTETFAVQTQACAGVLTLTKDMILLLDLRAAIAASGLTAQSKPTMKVNAHAVIVDADCIDRRAAAILRRHARAKVPVVAIVDSADIARAMGINAAICVSKPFLTDDLIQKLCQIIQPTGRDNS